VLGHESLFSQIVPAYVGPAPDLIPYFLGLLAWAGMAVAGILAWPVSAVIGRFRKAGSQGTQPPRSNLPESPGETCPNKSA
jgi:hypothetical protein